MESRFRALPSVDRLVTQVQAIDPDLPRSLIIDVARENLDAIRSRLAHGAADPGLESLARDIHDRVHFLLTPSLRPVINATGVILHTNLGRAPVSIAAAAAMAQIGSSYSNLEFDLEAGQRGSRSTHSRDLLCELTGAEDAIAVNNNAGALLLALTALAQGRDVIVSRSQAVEIGGGFRIPDVMAQSGARLVEVGTTNRTYVSDYQRSIGPATALLLRVHASNFRIEGFVHNVGIGELANLAREAGIGVLDDIGSGTLLDPRAFGLRDEPLVQESVRSGATVVCFSGDKLLGGPQAGLLVGKKASIDLIRRHPLARALRIDKVSLAGLEATLRHYQAGDALDAVPVWRMISTPLNSLEQRSRVMSAAIASPLVESVEVRSTIGGGSLPGETQPSWGVRVGPDDAAAGHSWSADRFAHGLRQLPRPIVGRVEKDAVFLDVRTVHPSDDKTIVAGVTFMLAHVV